MKTSVEVTTIRPQDVDARTLHGFLLGGIAPRPIAFVSSMDAEGLPILLGLFFHRLEGGEMPRPNTHGTTCRRFLRWS